MLEGLLYANAKNLFRAETVFSKSGTRRRMFHISVGGVSQAAGSGASPAIRRQLRNRMRASSAVIAMTAGMVSCGVDRAASQQASFLQKEPAASLHVSLARSKSKTFSLKRPYAQAVVGAPDIADVLPMSDREVYILGKKIGTTNVSVFDQDKTLIAVIDVDVTLDTQNIAARVHSGVPDSPRIRISSSNNQIILSGEARNSTDAEKAVAVAKSMVTAPDGGEAPDPGKYVINAMSVAASQQVMLRVRFIEVDRSAERALGVNWFGANGNHGINTGKGSLYQAGNTITNQTNSVSNSTGWPPSVNQSINSLNSVTTTNPGVPLFQTIGTLAGQTISAPFGVGLFNLVKGATSIDVLVTALEEKGLARKLAEPDLIALSGDTASFLAGGEIPVPSVQSSSGTAPVITTVYQQFGVQLSFIPTVLANGIINLKLNPSVSELDYKNAVTISGTTIPGLSKREARTTIELRDGQSFAIAGLLQSDNTKDISQIPWLGSVPVLGALFRSSAYSQQETDLVVIVTPHIVAPAAPGQALATPLDKTLPSNDVDFFLMGQPEVRKQFTDYVTGGGQLNGPYGHMMPLEPK
jgi:pilus assembly protein CpaC